MDKLEYVTERSRTPEETGSIHEELSDANQVLLPRYLHRCMIHTPPKKGREEGENDGQSAGRQATGLKQDTPLPQEDCKAQFYKQYRNVADEYDKDFLKKHKDNLNTTLIFAGLFSAVTSAFIVMVDSRLQPDRGSETTALLRVLIYKTDNTTFKDDVPSLPPQWTGPPPAMVDVEAILYMSLVASLFSAFLAMLGKQWLNRYASTDLRGSVIERGQNRQRKLDGVDTWYFDAVMESLPLMLQAALLLLGCALSRYLWEVDVTVASVVIGVTSFGVVLYLFILVAGVVSEVCPYQTPGSYFIRHLVQHVPSASALGDAISGLDILETAHAVAAPLSHRLFDDDTIQPYVASALFIALVFPTAIYRIGRATTRVSSQVLVGACGLFCRACCWLQREQIVEEQVAMLDSRCILWTSQTSLDKPVHHSIVRYLATIPKLHNFDPTLVTLCYNVFVGCVSITDGKVVIVEGLDEPAAASIRCLFRTFHHLMATDPTSSVLCNLFLCYQTNFPHRVVSTVLPFYATMMTIHLLVDRGKNLYEVSWDNSSPSIPDHVAITQDLVKAAMVEYKQRSKVSRWILRFVLHSLSMDPPLPASAVADCLTIVAIDLDCDISDITFLDERYVQI
ncbi:hypothetical protein BJ322DRAFT_293868 [Thelephora terrestris]|uniref:DUF6535 domain-containing protein n=1 Tax=Thelephora terrestris TaxID=56493 RepID=A0A9P6H6P0_9AGAM|nr:hypothetical protein BJ322DRAFT_293868 [Thelephora terrestris]